MNSLFGEWTGFIGTVQGMQKYLEEAKPIINQTSTEKVQAIKKLIEVAYKFTNVNEEMRRFGKKSHNNILEIHRKMAWPVSRNPGRPSSITVFRLWTRLV